MGMIFTYSGWRLIANGQRNSRLSPVARVDIIARPPDASISVGEKGGRAWGKIMQLYYEYRFWCLPAGVDPEVAAALNWQEIIF